MGCWKELACLGQKQTPGRDQLQGRSYLLPKALSQRPHCMLGGAVESAPIGCIGHPVPAHGGDVDDVPVLPPRPHVLDQQLGLKRWQGLLAMMLSVACMLSWGACPEGLGGRGRCRTGLVMSLQSCFPCSSRRGVVHV